MPNKEQNKKRRSNIPNSQSLKIAHKWDELNCAVHDNLYLAHKGFILLGPWARVSSLKCYVPNVDLGFVQDRLFTSISSKQDPNPDRLPCALYGESIPWRLLCLCCFILLIRKVVEEMFWIIGNKYTNSNFLTSSLFISKFTPA